VSAIRPLIAERGVWRPDESPSDQRDARFMKAAIAGLKQSGLAWLPRILPPATPAELEFVDSGLVVLGSAAADAAPIRELLERRRGISRATVIVGPEGGLTESEERALVSKGAARVRAGPGTLRVETAVVVLVSLVASLGA
jgi:16S rRNA (uracil1498-N3)-methyltransferase